MKLTASVLICAAWLAGLAAGELQTTAAPADEPPPTFRAAQLLTPAQLKGPHHVLADTVSTDGYYHAFTIQSDFGAFEAAGRTMLAVRVHEIGALAQLKDVSKTEVFLKAAGTSVLNLGQGVAAAVTKPTETAKGVGSGVKRLGVNLGRMASRTVDSATGDDPAEGSTQGGNAAVSAGKSLAGISKASRRWAQKLGVDPYTTNTVLKKALDSIGEIDAAGSIVTKVVLPVPGIVGMTATVSGLVWSKDPEELRKINEQRLRELGVPDATAHLLFRNSGMTLTYETRLIAALHALKLPGSADRVAAAAQARHEREALFHVESAELLQQRHAKTPFTRLLTDSSAAVAATAGGTAVVLLPLDWVRWTAASEETVREIDARARKELKATRVDALLTGKTSSRAAKELADRGWSVISP